MANLDTLLTFGLGGAILGTGYYLYKNGYLLDFLPPPANGDGKCTQIGLCVEGLTWDDEQCKCVPTTTEPQVPKPIIPGTSGIYSFWAKKKMQCRDNHLTFSFLIGQNVRVLNYKLFNDGKIYTAVCGAPSPLTVLIAIDAADTGSASILQSLGFTQYFAPPTEPNPSVPIPNPPSTSNYAMSMAYVGEAPGHKAYKVYRHYSNRGR